MKRSLSTKDSESRFNTYRERITKDEENDSNEEESSTLNESFSFKKKSGKDSRDNEIDKKDNSEQQNINKEFTGVRVKTKLVRFTRDRKEFITSITDISVSTYVITFKSIHSDSFRGETIKIRIFILQVDNKITDATEISKERKIWYVMSLIRKVTTK